MKRFSLVYHVANPSVPGIILKKYPEDFPKNNWIGVIFLKKVEFSGNIQRGKHHYWLCSSNPLFKSSKEAFNNHDPKRA